MDLIVHQVVQLHEVDVTHGDLVVKALAGAAIVQPALTLGIETSLLEGVAELDSSGYVQAGEDGRTSVEGLFAAGDVRTKALRQVITAAADGANCVASAEKYLLENRG